MTPEQIKEQFIANLFKNRYMSYNPRRNRLDLMHPAELAIHNAIGEIEKLPADVELTNAQVLLSQGKDKVSDYLDAHPEVRTTAAPVPSVENVTFKIRDWEMAKRRIGYLNYQGAIGLDQLVNVIAHLEEKSGYESVKADNTKLQEMYDALSPEEKEAFDKSKLVQSTPPVSAPTDEELEKEAEELSFKVFPSSPSSVVAVGKHPRKIWQDGFIAAHKYRIKNR